MAQDVNWTSQEWCDIVFEGKNKEYGAYTIRRTTSKRHTVAMIAVLVVAICTAVLPTIVAKAKEFARQRQVENLTGEVELANLGKDTPEEEIEEPKPIEQEMPPDLKSSIAFMVPEIDAVNPNDTLVSMVELNKSKEVISVITIHGTNEDGAADWRDLAENQKTGSTDGGVVKPVEFPDVEADFPGGVREFYTFLREKTVYPQQARDLNLEGTTQVQFVVYKDGTVGDVKVLRSSYPVLDAEAVRVVKMSPKWIPGKVNGKPVASYYRIPILFQLNQ